MTVPESEETTVPGLVVLNPSAGDGEADTIRGALAAALPSGSYQVFELTGDASLADRIAQAVDAGVPWVAAAGGDGTVSAVADHLVNSGVPLAIIPAGTGNVVAGALAIGKDIETACRLLADNHTLRPIDAICVGDRHYLMSIGVGLEAQTMEETTQEEKNRWGGFAYWWSGLKQFLGWGPQPFSLTIDGETHRLRAAELVIANVAEIGLMDMEWYDEIKPDDGQIDVVALQARSLGDALRVAFGLAGGEQQTQDEIQHLTARQTIRLTGDSAMSVQGDGEIIAGLPLEAELVPKALKVLVPAG